MKPRSLRRNWIPYEKCGLMRVRRKGADIPGFIVLVLKRNGFLPSQALKKSSSLGRFLASREGTAKKLPNTWARPQGQSLGNGKLLLLMHYSCQCQARCASRINTWQLMTYNFVPLSASFVSFPANPINWILNLFFWSDCFQKNRPQAYRHITPTFPDMKKMSKI